MKITIFGLNHKTADVAIREKFSLTEQQAEESLGQLTKRYPDSEFALLSTCNRTEFYSAVPGDVGPDVQELIEFLCAICHADTSELRKGLYIHEGSEAVRHLLEVAGSLDSLVVGEPQILAQVKDCYRQAIRAGTAGRILHRLFHCAFSTSKEIYTMTSIGQRRVSVAGIAVELAKKVLGDLSVVKVAVIGAGEMGELVIRHLLEGGCGDITLYNRTGERAEKTARKYNIQTGSWARIAEGLGKAEVIVASATAEEYLFDASIFHNRESEKLVILDIAVPRNFHPDVGRIKGVHLYSVDDLSQVIQENIQARQEDLGQAQEIIEDNVASFIDWFGVRDVGPRIGKLRKQFDQIARDELQRYFRGEGRVDESQRQKIEAMTNRLINKLLHGMVQGFFHIARQQGSESSQELIERLIDEYEPKKKNP